MPQKNINNIKVHFNRCASNGSWQSYYNLDNPRSRPFIKRKEKVLSYLDIKEGHAILDLGCGTGMLLGEILLKKGKYFGIDFSEQMLQTIIKKYDWQGDYRLTLSDCCAIPYKSNSFDYVVGVGLFEYLEASDKFLQEAARVLKPSGKLVFTITNINSINYRIVMSTGLVRRILRNIFHIKRPDVSKKMYYVDQIAKMLDNSNFYNTVVDYFDIEVIPYPLTRIFLSFSNYINDYFEDVKLSLKKSFATGMLICTQAKKD